MSLPSESRNRVRFGDFEIDLRTAELRNNGHKLTLQGQPFQILTVLLERPGELVTREELKRRLWTSDTFVDFEHSLNKAVNRLREALEDSPEQPKYVETLPRRGYRFIASVERGHDEAEALVAPSPFEKAGTSNAELSGDVPPKPPAWPRAAKGFALACATIALVAAAWWMAARRNSQSRVDSLNTPLHSLAVLPLENLSGDASQDYFADAVTDQLITDLGRLGKLRVISRTSVMQYKKTHKTLHEIARELNVDAIVEGTVTRSGENVRITAQLIRAETDTHLWADAYDGNLHDVLGLQESVAYAIADRVANRLGASPQHAARNRRTVSPPAYEAYLQGFAQPTTIDGTQNSVNYFESAIQLQPDYAEAYSELARSYTWLGHMLALPPQESFAKAKAAAEKAIELDDEIADVHATLGQIHLLYDWNFVAAEKELRRALELNPNSFAAHAHYAEVLAASGRYEEAIGEAQRTQQIDPVIFNSRGLSGFLYWSRRYDEAIAESQRILAANPNCYQAHLFLGLALEQKRRFSAALPELKKAVELSNDKMWIGFVAHDLALSGDRAGARKILREMEEISKYTYVSPMWPAIVYPDLGDKEKAYSYLEKAFQGREHDLIFSDCWPMFDVLRGDERFNDLRRRIGLPAR